MRVLFAMSSDADGDWAKNRSGEWNLPRLPPLAIR
jgi:hypothetical protein